MYYRSSFKNKTNFTFSSYSYKNAYTIFNQVKPQVKLQTFNFDEKSLQTVDLVIILLSGRTINFGKVVSKQPTLHHLKSVI